MANRLFAGASPSPPAWAMTRGGVLRNGLGAQPAVAGAASPPEQPATATAHTTANGRHPFTAARRFGSGEVAAVRE